jgi:hypothetical protein
VAEVTPTLLALDPGREIWERLRDGDPTAPVDLAEAFLDTLVEWLIAHNPWAAPDLCESAAGDSILALSKRPESYDPSLLTVEAYLRMSASGDLKNALRSERRHRERRANLEAVELSPVVGKNIQDQREDPALVALEREAQGESRAVAEAIVDRVRRALSRDDALVLELMLNEERKTSAYARALGVDDRPIAEQEQIVNRAKDRVKKRLQRARGKHE